MAAPENYGSIELTPRGMASAGIPKPGEMTQSEKIILIVALFLKGGILGAYGPFIALWLHIKSWSASQVGALSACDILFSIILVPCYGLLLDKYRIHNIGIVISMLLAAVLKLLYVPYADNFYVLLVLTALTAPLLKGANSILDGQALYAFSEKSEFGKVRYFGSLGFGTLAFLTGMIVSHGKIENIDGTSKKENLNAFITMSGTHMTV